MLASFNNFRSKMWVGFCLNTKKSFVADFFFKAIRNSIDSPEKGPWDFWNSSLFDRSACF